MPLTYIVLATFLVSLISLIGIITLSFNEKFLKKIILILVALSAGALFGGAFLHLIPESLELLKTKTLFLYTIAGFSLFFFVENILQWRHCHKKDCPVHSFAYMNLFGETIHNFIDGLIIASAFIINTPLGITTTLAVALHEIPQEIGDFGVLIHGGFKKSKAIFLNFLVSLTAILGGIFGFYLSSFTEFSMALLLPIAAGGFIYIAASDLIPEIRKESSIKKTSLFFLIFLLGILIMSIL